MRTCLQTHSLEMLAVGVPLLSLSALPNCSSYAQPAPDSVAAATLNAPVETPGFAVSAAVAGRGALMAALTTVAVSAMSLLLA
jgi:hypothetical protein